MKQSQFQDLCHAKMSNESLYKTNNEQMKIQVMKNSDDENPYNQPIRQDCCAIKVLNSYKL